MATLDLSVSDTLRLTLRGADENAILTTLRRWSYWTGAEVDQNPTYPSHCRSVTLITNRVQESTIRSILQRSFGMKFPLEGGEHTR